MAFASLDVNWEEVRMLASQVGVREAARRLGIGESAVMQRSAREGWMDKIPRSQPLPPTVKKPVSMVSTPAQALAKAMQEDQLQTRASALRVSRRAVAAVEQLPDAALLDKDMAQTVHTHIKSAALAGGWANQAPPTNVTLRLAVTAKSGDESLPMVESEAYEMPELPTLGEVPSSNVADY